LTSVERSGHDERGNNGPKPCQGGESFVGHVALHVGEEGRPTGVDDGGGGSLRSNGVAARIWRVSCAFLANEAVTGLVPPPRHVVVAPVEDAVLGADFLLLWLARLGRSFLPLFVCLLILLV